MNTLPLPPDAVPLPPPGARRQVLAAYDKIAGANRPELWTSLRSCEDVLVDAKAVDERVRAGERLPLAGLLVAVKDDVKVTGLPATDGPDGAGKPQPTAVAVQRLIQAGAVVLGKTGPEAGAAGRGKVAGWGSALAVALGLVDVALDKDPAGSGGAACHGIIGIRPTRGLVPTTGLSRAREGVTVFARTVADGQRALCAMTGPDASDAGSRRWPAGVRLAAGERPRVAVADQATLSLPSEEAGCAYQRRIEDLLAAGVVVETIDIVPFVEAVSVARGRNPRSGEWRARVLEALDGCLALVLPVLAHQPARATRGADPRLAGLLDLAAVTVPAGQADGGPFGISVLARSFDDQVALDLAALLTGEQVNEPYPGPGIDLVVFGAHLRGQPLNHQLAELGARFRGQVATAERYRMVALPTVPPTPGIVRACPGAALAGERWTISPAGLERFLAGLPEAMAPYEIELEGGGTALGFQCDAGQAAGAKDITKFGDWRAYLRHLTATRPMIPLR
ncbi:allophanate hydrolase-related protein [Amycolatopsis taiwanensis]|uniref:Amidase n=1 Tax=Amycolatopsis taiwanensis TaxID=342230 RepID=A0A9W6R512_9PSEU|nr:amidase family protein [Amycolatopsis taiwanensis]GLY69378.1 amidase [Amycolatopsis taiwanensis]